MWKRFHFGGSGRHIKMSEKFLNNISDLINCHCFLMLDVQQYMPQIIVIYSQFVLPRELLMHHGWDIHVVTRMRYQLKFWIIYSLGKTKAIGLLSPILAVLRDYKFKHLLLLYCYPLNREVFNCHILYEFRKTCAYVCPTTFPASTK